MPAVEALADLERAVVPVGMLDTQELVANVAAEALVQLG